MQKAKLNNGILILKKIENRANYLLKHNYNKYIHTNFNKLIIENIMCNGKCHIVATFKNYLIEDDFSEYFHKYYKIKAAKEILNDLFYYHLQTSFIFPNYCPIIESKYLYNNVIKKQRIIDEQQEIEEDSKDNKKKEKKEKNENKENKENKDKLFTSSVYDEILNLSESVMRIVFGLKKQKNNANIKDIKNNNNEPKRNNYYDIDNNLNDINDSSELNDLIKKLNDEEIKSNNMNIDKNINKNFIENNAKENIASKLKLIIKNKNSNKINHKNNDVFHTITNNSINISNTFNNFKTIIENKNNKFININNINNIFITKNEGSINKKIINKNIINIINKYKNKNNNNNSKLLSKKLKSMDSKKYTLLPYSSLYGLNFINKNPLINELISMNTNTNNNINTNIKDISSRNHKNINFYNIFHSKPSFMNNVTKNNSTLKLNGSNHSNKFLNKISKLDCDNLETINNNMLTITNRRKSRNYDKFFKDTSLTISKRKKKKKINIRNIINPTLSLSPFHKKEKNHQLLYINKKSEKSMNSNKYNLNIIANSINESRKQFPINEYNYIKRINCENILKSKGNFSIKSFK